MDGRFNLDDPAPTTSTFALRKARPIFSGRVARFFGYRLMAEFGGGSASVLDAYVETRFTPALIVRAGKDKTPVGHELLLGDATLLFPERALASSLVPNRDVGIQVLGELAAGKISYAGGVFNGVPDGTSSTADTDANNSKDLAARIVVLPFRQTTGLTRPLNGLGFQFGGTTGTQTGALPSFRTSASGQTYFTYAASGTPTVAGGPRRRLSPAVFYYYKSLGAFGEFVQSTQTVVRGTTATAITNRGWEVSGAWLLTGEAASAGVPNPRRAFDPPAGRWGALQVVARHAELRVDEAAFEDGFAAIGSSRRARATTIGVNWYPTQVVKYYGTYERTTFNGPTPRAPDHTVLFRVQLAF